MFNPNKKINPLIFDELIELAKNYTKDCIDENIIEKYAGKNTHKSFCKVFSLFSIEDQKNIFRDASFLLRLSLKLRTNFNNF